MEDPALSLAAWIVLALVDEGPTHGFAVAALTADDGDVGRVWHVPRPIVYRSLDRLTDLGLVRVEATESGNRGPQRSVVVATPAGREAVAGWMDRPVGHVRDVRSELLVKLALHGRRGSGTAALVAAQQAAFQPVRDALEHRRETETGFGRVLAVWRAENVQAALRFLDQL